MPARKRADGDKRISEMTNKTIKTDYSDKSNIFNFAFCGTIDIFYDRKLKPLAELAEPEPWSSTSLKENDRLYNYITQTFKRCYECGYVSVSRNQKFCVFNTGLMTVNGNDIYGYFVPNSTPDAQMWFLDGFIADSDRRLNEDAFEIPKLAKYFSSPEETFFNSEETIIFNSDHIFEDRWEDASVSRFPEQIRTLGRKVTVSLIKAAFQDTLKKIKRNNRLAIPQFYNGKIMYLLPIVLPVSDTEEHTMALAVEKIETGYRVNTIFTLEMAYKLARLVMKPETNWLIKSS